MDVAARQPWRRQDREALPVEHGAAMPFEIRRDEEWGHALGVGFGNRSPMHSTHCRPNVTRTTSSIRVKPSFANSDKDAWFSFFTYPRMICAPDCLSRLVTSSTSLEAKPPRL